MTQTVLLGMGVVATFAICLCCIVGLGQLHRLVIGVNQMVDLLEKQSQRPNRK